MNTNFHNECILLYDLIKLNWFINIFNKPDLYRIPATHFTTPRISILKPENRGLNFTDGAFRGPIDETCEVFNFRVQPFLNNLLNQA